MTLTLWEPQVPELTEGAVSFVVFGEVKPGGSKRGFVHPHTNRVVIVEDSHNRPWRQEVVRAAMEATAGELRWPEGPLKVRMIFFRPRPRGHYGTGRNAGVVKPNAPRFPTTRPDVLKLARLVEDALTSVLWRDDAQIVDERLVKAWGEPERVEITVQPL